MPVIQILCIIALLAACGQPGQAPTAAASGTPSRDTLPPASAALPPDTAAFTIDYITGRFDPAAHPAFVKVEARHADGSQYLMHREAYAAFVRMYDAAQRDGVRLRIISATRNFERQKQIWEAKWTGARLLEGKEDATKVYPLPKDRALAILRYSSMPGTSRHHWGTDIDLNELNNAYFDSGEGKKTFDWLRAHAATYGFCQPYSPKGPERPEGYYEERWHWSYLPVAQQLTALASRALTDEQISGFKGAETAVQIGVVQKYILGISRECLPE